METYKIANTNEDTDYIKIKQVRAIDDKIVIKLDLSTSIRKYFLKDSFVVRYDKNIEDVDESILAIPPLFIIAPVAWAAGADIYVETLDQTSLHSLHKVRQVFQEWYPKFASISKICVKDLIDNESNGKQTGLLFSGGLDSLTSYIRHKNEHPILITMLRGENPTSYEYEYYSKVRDTFLGFANTEKVEIDFITSDIWDPNGNLLSNQLLAKDFGVTDWWVKVSHGLILLGLSAPLTVESIGKLYLASTYSRDYKPHGGQGSHFLAHMDFSWADVKVQYDVQELSRHEKIKHILYENSEYHKYLRVCNPFVNPDYHKESHSQSYVKNCGFCHKCVRTITSLILEGIDPSLCNFDVDDRVLDYVRRLLTTGALNLSGSQPEYWQDIQRHIPDTINDTPVIRRYQAEKFFEWLRNFDVSRYKYSNNETLRMLRWAYCLTRYRGTNYTVRLVLSHVRRNQAVSS